MKKYLLNMVILLVFLFVSRFTHATLYQVNPSTPGLKSIIENAISGDIIEFAQGTYSQLGLVVIPSGITLTSTDIEDWSVICSTIIENAAFLTSGSLDINGLSFIGVAAEYPNYLIYGMSCDLDVENCYFIDSAPTTIHVFSDSQADIKRSIFRYAGVDQKITASNSDVNIDNCLFDNHTRIAMDVWPPDGGPYYLDVVRCTFQSCDPDYVISVSGGCQARIRNSIFDDLGTRTVSTSVGGEAFIWNCCLPYRAEDYGSAYVDMIDNIHLDPLLVSSSDPGENYKLQDGSPCIDASVYVSIKDAGIESWLDIDFNSRVNNYNADIGAWEHFGTRQPRTWYVDCQSTDPLPDGTRWDKAFPTIQKALNICGVGDIIKVAPGNYIENLDLDAPRHNEITIQSSSMQPHTTTIQSSETYRIIDVYGVKYVTIKGFTLTGSTGGAIAFRDCPAGSRITNCIIKDNSANGTPTIYQSGGGIYCENSPLEVVNCLVQDNSALGNGGAAYKAGTGIMSFKNCTIYGNTSGIYNGGSQSYLRSYNTLFWNNGMNDYYNSDAYCCWSEQESDPDPQFIKAPDALWLGEGSGCIDAGNNDSEYYPGGISNPDPSTDLIGNVRFYDGDEDDTVTIDIGAYEYQPVFPRIYVDAYSDDYDGSSWITPFKYLQDALMEARNSEGYVKEIWVADGTYYPDTRKENLPPGTGIREETFQIIDGLRMYGGFQGVSTEYPLGESSILERSEDKSQYPSILNGDIDADAQESDYSTRSSDRSKPPASSRIEEIGNCYNVVSAIDITSGRFDRFTVQNGEADGTFANSNGAGAVVINSLFQIVDCTFTDNVAVVRGGAMYLVLSDPNLYGCTFTNNDSAYGAAIFNYASNPSIEECVFNSNDADAGGAIFNHTSSSPRIESCVFQDNSASSGTETGGAIANEIVCSPKILNSVFAENTATDGGALFGWYLCDFSIINCTCAYNEAGLDGHGGGLYLSNYSTALVYNSIFWDNSVADNVTFAAQIYHDTYADIQYSCVTGIVETNNNINDDPLFQNPNPPPGNIIGPSHDGNESFYLGTGSPCIDSGFNDFVPSYLYTDIAGYNRIQNEIVDRGAYEVGDEVPNSSIVIMAWINEADGYTLSEYNQDLGEYDQITIPIKDQGYIFNEACFVPPNPMRNGYDIDDPVDDVIPSGGQFPEGFVIENFIGLDATTDDFWYAFNSLCDDFEVTEIIMVVDVSGSMGDWLNDTQFDEFVDELVNAGYECYVKSDDTSEEWLGMINEVLTNKEQYQVLGGRSVLLSAPSSVPAED